MNYRLPFLFLLLFALCFALAAGAQQPQQAVFGVPDPAAVVTNTSSLTGSVRSFAGQPLRNVRIELQNPGSGQVSFSTYTLPNGSFELDNLPNGHYEVVATQGVNEAREQVQIDGPGINVTLRMPTESEAAAAGSQDSVSVAQLKVPSKARNLYRKAQEHADKNKISDALHEVEQALKIAPTYAPALTLRGLIAMQQGKAPQAVSDLEAAVQHDPTYGLAYIVLGSAYNMASRFDDAIRVLSRAESLAPSAWQLHFELSKALLGKGDFTRSLQQAAKAGELSSVDYPPLHLVMARAYLGMKSYPQAITELEQFLRRDPHSADAAQAQQTLDQARAFAGQE